MGHWPLLSCSAKPLPSEITGTCTGEVAAGWPKQRAEASKQCSMGGWRMPGEAKHSLYSSSTESRAVQGRTVFLFLTCFPYQILFVNKRKSPPSSRGSEDEERKV